MIRATDLRRCLRLLDGGASIEHVLGQAWDSGHSEGSGLKELTAYDLQSLESLGAVDTEDLDQWERAFPALVQSERERRAAELRAAKEV